MDADALATGHYARITHSGDRFELRRAADPSKDQSYFLYMLGPSQLPRLLFPVGGLEKTQVRGIAESLGLATAGKRDSQASHADTAIDSPYNTYKYRGLPLGPISNPGLESIQAALEPLDSSYWYYLSVPEGETGAIPEGETIFSRTLEEHNKAKQRFLR